MTHNSCSDTSTTYREDPREMIGSPVSVVKAAKKTLKITSPTNVMDYDAHFVESNQARSNSNDENHFSFPAIDLDFNSNDTSLSKTNRRKQILEVTVPPGLLGVDVIDGSNGVCIVSSSCTEFLVNDVILQVDNQIVETKFECANAFLKNKDKARILKIERDVDCSNGDEREVD